MTDHVFSVQPEQNIQLTPAGSFYAIQSPESNTYRKVLLRLMQNKKSLLFSKELATRYTGLDTNKALEVIHNMEKAGFISASANSQLMPDQKMDTFLPQVLPQLSDQKRIILCDSSRGFFLDYNKFSLTEAEELAVLSSSLRALYEKNADLIENKLSIKQSAFGIIDPAGHSELGFWPLFIGNNIFSLVISGLPQFNSLAFKQLIWVLIQRYGQT